MPPKNSLKIYVNDGYYHIYNRGVEKRKIFADHEDYVAFLGCLKLYLTPPKPIDRRFSITLQGDSLTDTDKTIYAPSRQPSNYNKTIQLVAYCLMPNHFHLLLKQTDRNTIGLFMRSLATRYSMYFNKKYERVGKLFQGTYKAVLVERENQFTYLTKYIHRNPLKLISYRETPCKLSDYQYSSYRNYLGLIHQTWLYPDDVLCNFSTNNPNNSYQNFVEEDESEVDHELTLE